MDQGANMYLARDVRLGQSARMFIGNKGLTRHRCQKYCDLQPEFSMKRAECRLQKRSMQSPFWQRKTSSVSCERPLFQQSTAHLNLRPQHQSKRYGMK